VYIEDVSLVWERRDGFEEGTHTTARYPKSVIFFLYLENKKVFFPIELSHTEYVSIASRAEYAVFSSLYNRNRDVLMPACPYPLCFFSIALLEILGDFEQ